MCPAALRGRSAPQPPASPPDRQPSMRIARPQLPATARLHRVRSAVFIAFAAPAPPASGFSCLCYAAPHAAEAPLPPNETIKHFLWTVQVAVRPIPTPCKVSLNPHPSARRRPPCTPWTTSTSRSQRPHRPLALFVCMGFVCCGSQLCSGPPPPQETLAMVVGVAVRPISTPRKVEHPPINSQMHPPVRPPPHAAHTADRVYSEFAAPARVSISLLSRARCGSQSNAGMQARR